MHSLLASLFVAAIISASRTDTCAWMRQFEQPQPMFDAGDNDVTLKLAPLKHSTLVKPRRAPSGNYEFSLVETERESAVVVHRGSRTDLKVTPSDYAWRPLSAQWINAKLLYVSLSFSPHVGMYWVVDVEKEAILANETAFDGWDAWNQCGLGK